MIIRKKIIYYFTTFCVVIYHVWIPRCRVTNINIYLNAKPLFFYKISLFSIYQGLCGKSTFYL